MDDVRKAIEKNRDRLRSYANLKSMQGEEVAALLINERSAELDVIEAALQLADDAYHVDDRLVKDVYDKLAAWAKAVNG